jgi:hypothetical protein
MYVESLLDLSNGRFYPPGDIAGIQLCQRLSKPQGHGAVGRFISMKTIDPLAFILVPQPNAPPRAPRAKKIKAKLSNSQIMSDVSLQ